MPKTKVPEWFDYICKGGIPCFWVRGKFPNVVLASLFLEERKFHHPVKLHLVINGQSVPRNSHKVCDLRLLYNDEEWLSIDALLLKHEWNQVQISYEVRYGLTLSEWGVFVNKQGRTVNLEDHVQFMCPDPTRYSNITEEIVFDTWTGPEDKTRDKPHDKVTIFQNMKKLLFCH
ncbi:hypothetical protein P8452_49349 [Trifolium repens]|nr:hypothetical protein P8452_49349 [Trifolium repens]